VIKVSREAKLGRRVAANLGRCSWSIRESYEGLVRPIELPVEPQRASP
jgi:hypothetical protein